MRTGKEENELDRAPITKKSALREYAEAIVIALLLALFIRTFIVQAFKIPSGSMIKTLLIGDHILVNKFIFGPRVDISDLVNFRLFTLKKPERGDIVVFLAPQETNKDYIKRVIGLPGETIEVRDRRVLVNGVPIEEEAYVFFASPYPVPALDNVGPLKVPEGHYFVMGDNRENSNDSRVWGTVPFELIKGKAILIYWSWNGPDFRVRWSRLGDLIR